MDWWKRIRHHDSADNFSEELLQCSVQLMGFKVIWAVPQDSMYRRPLLEYRRSNLGLSQPETQLASKSRIKWWRSIWKYWSQFCEATRSYGIGTSTIHGLPLFKVDIIWTVISCAKEIWYCFNIADIKISDFIDSLNHAILFNGYNCSSQFWGLRF